MSNRHANTSANRCTDHNAFHLAKHGSDDVVPNIDTVTVTDDFDPFNFAVHCTIDFSTDNEPKRVTNGVANESTNIVAYHVDTIGCTLNSTDNRNAYYLTIGVANHGNALATA